MSATRFSYQLYSHMRKSEQLMSQRRQFIKQEVKKAKQSGLTVEDAVRSLESRLFLSRRTIFNDLTAA